MPLRKGGACLRNSQDQKDRTFRVTSEKRGKGLEVGSDASGQ